MTLTLLAVVLSVAAPGTRQEERPPAETGTQDEAARKQAKALVEEAQKLYAQKRYAEAAARFERAYALRSVPALLFNLARCFDKMMDTPKALRAYRDYLRAAPGASDVAEVQASIVSLEKRLRSLGLSQLLVLTNPPRARVKVDGKDLGESPVSVELVTGRYDVSLTLEGHVPESRVVEVKLEESPFLSVKLKQLPPDAPRAEPVPRLPAASAEVAAAQPMPPAPLLPPPIIQLVEAPSAHTEAPAAAVAVTPQAEPPRRTATWVAAGTTGAVLIAGVGLLAAAHWNAYQLVNDETFDASRRNALLKDATSYESLSTYVFMGAALPAAATGVLFLLGK